MAILTPELLNKLKYGYYFWPLLFVCSSVVAVVNYIIELWFTVRHTTWIDGPRGLPLLGNAADFFGKTCPENFKLLNSLIDKYDGLAKIWIFHRPTLLITRQPLVEKLLKGTADTLLSRGEQYNYLDQFIGKGILTLIAKDWHQRRKICNPYFESNLKDFLPKISHHAKALVEHFKNKTNAIDIQQYAKLTSLDLATDIFLDHQQNYLNNKDTSYTDATKSMTDIVMKRALTPIYNWSVIYFFTMSRLLQAKASSTINSLTKKVISKARNAKTDKNTQQSKSLVAYLLDKQEESVGTTGTINKNIVINDISDNFVQWEINHFTFSSTESLSSAVAFTLYTLGQHQAVQEKLYDEILEVTKSRGTLSDTFVPTLDELNKLQFMGRCLKETLRLYPPVPWIFRTLRNTIRLDNEKYLPEGINLAISIYKIHRDAKHYPNPDSFNPERFADDRFDDTDNYTYAPFGIGWRNCIGRKLAIIEMKIILLHILSEYKILSVGNPESLEITANYILRSQNGLNIKLSPRQ